MRVHLVVSVTGGTRDLKGAIRSPSLPPSLPLSLLSFPSSLSSITVIFCVLGSVPGTEDGVGAGADRSLPSEAPSAVRERGSEQMATR